MGARSSQVSRASPVLVPSCCNAYGALCFRFDIHKDINVFETTIRIVGGLLGAYELSGDDMFLSKAAELADELLLAFDTYVIVRVSFYVILSIIVSYVWSVGRQASRMARLTSVLVWLITPTILAQVCQRY